MQAPDGKSRLKLWVNLYRSAAPIQAALAIAGGASGAILWYRGLGKHWLTGSLLAASVVPFTLAIIAPLANHKLFALHEQVNSEQTSIPIVEPEIARLLVLWNRLHAVRSVASLLGFAAFLYALLPHPLS